MRARAHPRPRNRLSNRLRSAHFGLVTSRRLFRPWSQHPSPRSVRPPSMASVCSTRLVPCPSLSRHTWHLSSRLIRSLRLCLPSGLVRPAACSAIHPFCSSSVRAQRRGPSFRPSPRRLTCWRAAAPPLTSSLSWRAVCPSPCRNLEVVFAHCAVVILSAVWLLSVSAWQERTTFRRTLRAGIM